MKIWNLSTMLLVLFTLSLAAASAAEDVAEDIVKKAYGAYEASDPATCLKLYRQALEAGRKSEQSPYNAACCAALAGDTKSAYKLLMMAAERGWRDVDHLKSDADLKSLRGTPQWARVVSAIEANQAAYRSTVHSELHDLYQQDQGDRQVDNPDPEHWEGVNKRDQDRRQRVLELVAAGEPKVAADFFHAAMVLQHGEGPEDYKMAHDLARRAAELDPNHRTAKWLSAAAWDRFLWHTDKPQIYGTQFSRKKEGPWTIEPFDREAVTDEERKALNVPVLEDTLKRLEAMNKQLEDQLAAAGKKKDEDSE